MVWFALYLLLFSYVGHVAEPQESLCGNSRVEGKEECDVGWIAGKVEDPCCERNCTLKSKAKCSDKNSPCCNDCTFVPSGIQCRDANPNTCEKESFCNGLSAECPLAEAEEDGTACLDRGQCKSGRCESYCETKNMQPCMFDEGSCGGTIHVDSQIALHSPNYPNVYPANTACTWKITGPQSIRLRFEVFQLESCTACGCDYLEVRDGNITANTLLGKFCGSAPPPMNSTKKQFIISFKSDSRFELAGFHAILEPVCAISDHLECFEDNKCISKNMVCNGKRDCSTGIDENICMPCRTTNLTIPYGKIGKTCDEDIEVEHMGRIDVACKKGYTLESNPGKSIQCINGKWSSIPNCLATCSSPTDLPGNVQLMGPDNATYIPEEQVFIKCLNGYFVSNGLNSQFMMITCKGNDQWMPNKFQCLPQSHFRHIYKPQPFEIIEAQLGQTLILFCDREMHPFPSERGRLSFQWLRNTVDIRAVPNIMFRITAEGNLVLLNVSAEYNGMYSCLIKEQLKYLALSNVTYIVKTNTVCLLSPANTTVNVHQNTAIAMFCPYAESDFLDPPVWFNTKGKRIFNDVKYSLISNIGLLLKSAQYSDQGSYTCDLGPNTPFCERHFITNLQVIPTYDDFCGLSRNSAGFPWLVTLWWNDETAPFCYGALVNKHWVVTTAFCLIGLHQKRNPDVYVKFGQQNLRESVGNSTTTILVEYAKMHPQYSLHTNMADIGVIKLKQAVAYTNEITPICLTGVNFKMNPDNSSCDPLPPITGEVSGLGSLEADLNLPGAECMEVAPEETCPIKLEGVSCARGCESLSKYVADAGSPFQVLRNDKMYLYGIYSWVERRDKLAGFDYFTVLHPYYKWIASYTSRKD